MSNQKKTEESAVCKNCGQVYLVNDENRIWVGDEPRLRCPYCGFTNISVYITDETDEEEYDVDEEEWLREHPEQDEQPIS